MEEGDASAVMLLRVHAGSSIHVFGKTLRGYNVAPQALSAGFMSPNPNVRALARVCMRVCAWESGYLREATD